MILPKSEDAIHKAQLLRLLTEILDDIFISPRVFFKGGTAASMLGFLDRFSIDLDFDLKGGTDKTTLNKHLAKIFKEIDLELKQKSSRSLFYLLKYQSERAARNTIKLSIVDDIVTANEYSFYYLPEIDRYSQCQTKETMFANKLVAITDRYKKHKTIAGRDIYDIHYFFIQGYKYNHAVIEERTGKNVLNYFKYLLDFIEKKVTAKVITENLGFLLEPKKFQLMRKVLKQETLMLLRDEIRRLIEV
ncbi:hypothetical protein A2690_03185 [Candidatus Roizmanbacteria bacterium RIFCSPHIGHO2_01_FULL_39_12b]|uniref:Nucleotidyl transferase AbiEii/AbiGii toxin family protein n=1 Tax=Candidatus Roizmanbacteria bacterium RIFCSPHIGHO2_01_FULL_39_12b TaxID=1802030 RepID=A0A1F7GBJ1_9BACT|nr:MAG: hypothetical protein A2690_03185 [Candidatus Roizmanbacteria bacterium RIFCSPHIGHO2_01_FULL_39_12b]